MSWICTLIVCSCFLCSPFGKATLHISRNLWINSISQLQRQVLWVLRSSAMLMSSSLLHLLLSSRHSFLTSRRTREVTWEAHKSFLALSSVGIPPTSCCDASFPCPLTNRLDPLPFTLTHLLFIPRVCYFFRGGDKCYIANANDNIFCNLCFIMISTIFGSPLHQLSDSLRRPPSASALCVSVVEVTVFVEEIMHFLSDMLESAHFLGDILCSKL